MGRLVTLTIHSGSGGSGSGVRLTISLCEPCVAVSIAAEASGVRLSIDRAGHALVDRHPSPAAAAPPHDSSPVQARLELVARELGLSSARFCRTPQDYYEHELEWRREVLGACSTAALCKSMIMENTRLSGVSAAEAAGLGRYKRVCVVLQYDGPKLDKHKLTDVVRGLEGRHAAAKRQYSLRMVSGEESLALSGFEHNAVTPLGMATPMPLLVSERLRGLADGTAWLGGGEPDLKLRVDIRQFVASMQTAWPEVPVVFADVVGPERET